MRGGVRMYHKQHLPVIKIDDLCTLTLSRPQGFRNAAQKIFLVYFSRYKIIQTSFGPISIALAVQDPIILKGYIIEIFL